MNFPFKVFGSPFDPTHGYKTVNKSSQTQLALRAASRENLHMSHYWTRSRTADAYQPTSQSTPRLLTDSCHTTVSSQSRTNDTHSLPDPYMVEEESLYLL